MLPLQTTPSNPKSKMLQKHYARKIYLASNTLVQKTFHKYKDQKNLWKAFHFKPSIDQAL
jgi:hypothetical protein